MLLEYGQTNLRLCFRRWRVAGIVICLIVIWPICHFSQMASRRISLLAWQRKCFNYDDTNAIVYSATRRASPYVPFGNPDLIAFRPGPPGDFDSDIVEAISKPRPECWESLPIKSILEEADWATAINGISPSVIVALHNRQIGGKMRLIVVTFSRHSPVLRVYAIAPSTFRDDAIAVELKITPPSAKVDEYCRRFIENSWQSLELHSAKMDNLDQTHFSVNLVVDSVPRICEFYLYLDADGNPAMRMEK